MAEFSNKDAVASGQNNASVLVQSEGHVQLPSPTGCEYYLLLRSRSESIPEAPSYVYEKHVLPLDPRSPALTEPTLRTSTLCALEKQQLAAINALLQEQNSRTVEDGQWVVVDLQIIEPTTALGLVLQFYQYGAPFSRGEICIKKKESEGEGRREETAVAESIPPTNGSVLGVDATSMEVPCDNFSTNISNEAGNVDLDSQTVIAETETQEETTKGTSLLSPSLHRLSDPDSNLTGKTTCPPTPHPVTESRDFNSQSAPEISSPQDLAAEPLSIPSDDLSGNAPQATSIGGAITEAELPPASKEACKSTSSPSNNLLHPKDSSGDASAVTPSDVAAEKHATSSKTGRAEYAEIKRLANTRLVEKRWEDAELLLKQQLKIETENLGIQSKETLQTMHRLANTYLRLGRQGEAEPYYKMCLDNRIKLLGEHHKTTLLTMYHLAVTYLNLNRFDEAEPFFKRCLEGRIKVYGEAHENTLATMHYLAVTYRALGRLSEAEILYRHCLEGRISIFGEKNEATLLTMYHLAITYVDLSRRSEAEPLLRRLLENRIEVLGEAHEVTVATMRHLAVALAELGRMEEAGKLLQRISELRTGASEETYENVLERLDRHSPSLGLAPNSPTSFVQKPEDLRRGSG